MNLRKANVWLAGSAALLAVPTLCQLSRDGGTTIDVGAMPLMFDGFTAENVGRVLVRRPKAEQPKLDPTRPDQPRTVAYDQLLLVRGDKGYKVAATPDMLQRDLAEAPVAAERIESEVFTHLRRIRLAPETIVRSEASDAQLAEYGLDEAHALVLRADDLAGKNTVAQLWVGNSSQVGAAGTEQIAGVYVRRPESRDVVLYEFDADVKRWRPEPDASLWIDKLLFRLEPAQLTSFTLRNQAGGERTYRWQKQSGHASWLLSDDPANAAAPLGAVRQTELEGIVQRLRYVAAQEFRLPLARAGNLQALGLQPAKLELNAAWQEGGQERRITLQVGDKVEGKNEYYLLCSEAQFLMTWPASLVAPLERDPRELFDPVAPTNGK